MAKDIPDYMREFDTSDDWGFTPVTSKPESSKPSIDPKNPTNVGTSYWNLGNHTLAICFIMCIVFVIYNSY